MLAQHPHDITLPTFSKHSEVKVTVTDSGSPVQIAQAWLDKFASVFSSGDASRLASIIHPDSWWRDFLTFTWDYRTIRGATAQVNFLTQHIDVGLTKLALYSEGKFAPSFQNPIEGLEWVESMFTYETRAGTGKGTLRLAKGDDGVWKAHFISTSLQELNGITEFSGVNRPHGGNNSLEGGAIKGNWQERRERQKEFLDEEPQVFIVGAGKFPENQIVNDNSRI